MKFYNLILIILIIFIKTGNVLSDTNIFDVNNIEIEKEDQTTNDILADRAIKKGFKELIDKILLTKDIGKIKSLQFTEIKDLVNFLNKTGCNIKWISKRSLKIIGVSCINKITYSVMFDRIEAGTYLIAAAITEGNLKIKNVIPNVIQTELNILRKIGAKITKKKDVIHIIGNKKIKSMNIKTAPYPKFPSDLQAQIMVLLCKADKKSLITEDIFENRFMHCAELNRMGAKILIKGNKAEIHGNINFTSAELMATDLRASASLILAALAATGKSVISRIYHLDRGYENIEKKLKKVGARIRRIN